jgi:hypothetical protein
MATHGVAEGGELGRVGRAEAAARVVDVDQVELDR